MTHEFLYNRSRYIHYTTPLQKNFINFTQGAPGLPTIIFAFVVIAIGYHIARWMYTNCRVYVYVVAVFCLIACQQGDC